MEHLTDEQIMNRLAKAAEDEGAKFQNAVVAGIVEKMEYMAQHPNSAVTVQRAARPTTTATRGFRPYPKECLPIEKRKEREDGFLEILAMVAKVAEDEERVPEDVANGDKDADPESDKDASGEKISRDPVEPGNCGELKKVRRPKKGSEVQMKQVD